MEVKNPPNPKSTAYFNMGKFCSSMCPQKSFPGPLESISKPYFLSIYYSAAVGKFELMGRFDPNGLNGNSRPATLDFGITFGDQKFPGMFQILETDWAQLKNVEWKYKK